VMIRPASERSLTVMLLAESRAASQILVPG
jgi:hypothetical protein